MILLNLHSHWISTHSLELIHITVDMLNHNFSIVLSNFLSTDLNLLTHVKPFLVIDRKDTLWPFRHAIICVLFLDTECTLLKISEGCCLLFSQSFQDQIKPLFGGLVLLCDEIFKPSKHFCDYSVDSNFVYVFLIVHCPKKRHSNWNLSSAK